MQLNLPFTQRTAICYTYWTLLVLITIFFTISGYFEITKNPATYPKTIAMGYPPFFILALGITKLIGAAALLLPKMKRLKEWAIAGFTFDVVFAFISGLSIASRPDCIKSFIVFIVLMGTYALMRKTEATDQTTSRA